MAGYRWNENAGRFINERGQFVSERAVRVVVDRIADAASERMAAASERLLAGEMSVAAWQAEMMQTIKVSQIAAATIAAGGADQMTPSRYGSAGFEIKTQYQYLREFAAQIESGQQKLNGSLTARARQYGQAARVAFERAYGRGQQQRGYRSVRNVLGVAEHCRQCLSLTAQGWMPIEQMPPIGSRICRSNDRCRLEYRRAEQEQAA